jgi:hypothetical protein
VLSKHQNFHRNGLPEVTERQRVSRAPALKLWQVCTLKARKNLPTVFGNHPFAEAYEKILADAIPQNGNVLSRLPSAGFGSNLCP